MLMLTLVLVLVLTYPLQVAESDRQDCDGEKYFGAIVHGAFALLHQLFSVENLALPWALASALAFGFALALALALVFALTLALALAFAWAFALAWTFPLALPLAFVHSTNCHQLCAF